MLALTTGLFLYCFCLRRRLKKLPNLPFLKWTLSTTRGDTVYKVCCCFDFGLALLRFTLVRLKLWSKLLDTTVRWLNKFRLGGFLTSESLILMAGCEDRNYSSGSPDIVWSNACTVALEVSCKCRSAFEAGGDAVSQNDDALLLICAFSSLMRSFMVATDANFDRSLF